MNNFQWIGTFRKDDHAITVGFINENEGIIISSSHRFGEFSTGKTGTFDSSKFKKIWE